MGTVSVNRMIAAPREAVWAVLADFGNISRWNDGVKNSWLTGGEATGIGATRHCDLQPIGKLEETVTEWVPNERMVVRIDDAKVLPIASGEVTFSLLHGGEGKTKVNVAYDYTTKWGFVGRALDSTIAAQLTTGFEGFLDDLATAARRETVTTSPTSDAPSPEPTD